MYAKSDFTVDSMKHLLSLSSLKMQTSRLVLKAKVCRPLFHRSCQKVSRTVSGWVYEPVMGKWWKVQPANVAKLNYLYPVA